MYQTILFDLDGTLTEPSQGIINAICYALRKMSRDIPTRESLLTFIGPPLKDSFEEHLGLTSSEADLAIAFYRDYFKEKGLFENRLYPGIRELLTALRQDGRQLILATSKPEVFARQILDYFDVAHYFDFIGGASLDTSRTQKGAVIAYALQASGINTPEQAIMIGDRKHDVMGARENGLSSIGVLYGYGSRKELEEAGADFLVDTVEALQILLQKED